MWTAAASVQLARRADEVRSFSGFVGTLLGWMTVVAVPMVLHGLYDALLTKDQNALALLAAIASFAWLGLQVQRAMPEAPVPAAA